jgi:hypothetical protein
MGFLLGASPAQATEVISDGDIAAGDFTGDGKADVASIWASRLCYWCHFTGA